MAPIRVGLVGLSTITPGHGAYTAGTWGLVHLASITASPHYTIVALCNSTAEKARQSIEHHKLGAGSTTTAIRAYGSPEELAADPDVDLVVVSVVVFKHYALVKPALLRGKNVLVEFPVAPSVAEVEELAELARKGGIKTVVGSQALGDPVLRKIRGLVQSNAIGDVVSTSWSSHVALSVSQGWPEEVKRFLNKDSGSSRTNICLGHGLEIFIATLGSLSNVQSITKTNEKTTTLLDGQGNVVAKDHKVTAPDNILVQGILENGGIASIAFRCSPASAGGEGIRWIITGTEGEIEFTSPPGYVQSLPEGRVLLRKWDGEAEEVKLDRAEPEYITQLPGHVVNTARLYEAFATGDEQGYSTFEASLKTHRLLETIRAGSVQAP